MSRIIDLNFNRSIKKFCKEPMEEVRLPKAKMESIPMLQRIANNHYTDPHRKICKEVKQANKILDTLAELQVRLYNKLHVLTNILKCTRKKTTKDDQMARMH